MLLSIFKKFFKTLNKELGLDYICYLIKPLFFIYYIFLVFLALSLIETSFAKENNANQGIDFGKDLTQDLKDSISNLKDNEDFSEILGDKNDKLSTNKKEELLKLAQKSYYENSLTNQDSSLANDKLSSEIYIENTNQIFEEGSSIRNNSSNINTNGKSYSSNLSNSEITSQNLVTLLQSESSQNPSFRNFFNFKNEELFPFLRTCNDGNSKEHETTQSNQNLERVYCPEISNNFQKEDKVCLVKHNYELDLIKPHQGNLNFKVCDSEPCVEMWLGNQENNSLVGNCSIFEENLAFTIKNLNQIEKIIVSDIYYDDYWRLYLKVNQNPEKLLLSLPNGLFPPETKGPCELDKSNIEHLNIDILPIIKSEIQKSNSSNNQTLETSLTLNNSNTQEVFINLKERVSVTRNGEGYARFKIYLNNKNLLTLDEYQNLECLNSFESLREDKNLSLNVDSSLNLTQNQNSLFDKTSNNLSSSVNKFPDTATKFPDGFAGKFPFGYDNKFPPLKITYECLNEPKNKNGCTTNTIFPICIDNFTIPKMIKQTNVNFNPLCREILFKESLDLQGETQNETTSSNVFSDSSNSNNHSSLNSNYDECPRLDFYDYCLEDKNDPHYFYCQKKSSKKNSCFNFALKEEDCQKSSSIITSSNPQKLTYEKLEQCEELVGDDNKTYDLCSSYKLNPNCTLIKKEHIQSKNETLNNESFLNNDNEQDLNLGNLLTFNCKHEKNESSTINHESITCPIDCMGTDCSNVVFENEANLTKTATILQALNYIQDDISCDSLDTTKNRSCKIFKGEEQKCRLGYGEGMNCCVTPSQISLNDYLKLSSYIISLKAAIGSASVEGVSYGSWASSSLLKSGQGVISSSVDSLLGTAEETSIKEVTNTFTQELTKKLADYVARIFGEEVKNQLFTETAAEGGTTMFEVNPQILCYAQGVMAAYVAYQVGKIAYQMLTACRPNEIEASIKIGLNACIQVGTKCSKKVLGKCLVYERTYCCYSSPFARILTSELIRTHQIGNTCEGIDLNTFANLDFSEINLDEWESELIDANLINQSPLDLDTLTGEGSIFNTSKRLNSSERTLERLQKTDFN